MENNNQNNNQNFNQNNNQAPHQAPPNNNMPVAALVCGLLALVFCFIPLRILDFLCLVFSVLAIVFGAKGSQIAVPNQMGLATAGLVLGIIGLVMYLVSMACVIAACTAFAILPFF